jgi:hypothetical protein
MRVAMRGVVEERSGRTELLVWSTLYGMALGATVPIAFGSESAGVIGAGLLAGGPLGFLFGRSIYASRPTTEGQTRAISFGSIWGAWQGFGWAEVADLGEDEFCDPSGCFNTGGGEEEMLRAAIVGSLLGVGTGLILGRKEIPSGTATTVSFGGLWGTWFGVGLWILQDDDDGGGDDDDGLVAALLGGDLGIIATAIGAPKWQFSRGRARLISVAGLAGLVSGFGILLITNPDDVGNEAILVPIATSALGLALGVGWTRNYDERARDNDDSDLGAALQWNHGKLRVGFPEPELGVLQRNARDFAPALRIPLFRAAF